MGILKTAGEFLAEDLNQLGIDHVVKKAVDFDDFAVDRSFAVNSIQ